MAAVRGNDTVVIRSFTSHLLAGRDHRLHSKSIPMGKNTIKIVKDRALIPNAILDEQF